jgi:hypothetical protein
MSETFPVLDIEEERKGSREHLAAMLEFVYGRLVKAKGEAAGMEETIAEADAMTERLETELAEAKALLREVEWQKPRGQSPGLECDTCPVCGGVEASFIGGKGHAPDCRLAKVLGA